MNRGNGIEIGHGTIAELAQLAPERKTKRWACPAVPFILIMPLLFVLTLIAAIVPSISIISSSADIAINDAIAQIIVVTAQSASASFLQQMKEVKDNTAIAADSPLAFRFMTTEVQNYQNNQELNLFITRYIKTVGGSIAYYQKQNHTGLMREPPNPGFLNLTYYASFTPNSICWVDYGRTYSLCDNVDTVSGRVSGSPYPNTFANFGDPAQTPAESLAKTMNNCPADGAWMAALIYGTTFLAHARCPSAFAGRPAPIMALTAFSQDPNFFQYSAPTATSRVFLMANENKLIIANQNISVANSDKTDLVEVTKAADPIIAELGSKLILKYGGGVSKFPEYSNTEIQNYRGTNGVIQKLSISADGGADWITCALKLRLGNDSSYVLVVSMPQSHFTGAIESSIRNGAIVAAVFTTVGCILGVILTFLATRPLGNVTEAMAKATNFDFSMLENGEFDERSIFLEIKKLQVTFNTMIKAFAGGIRKNRMMMEGNKIRSTDQSVSSSYGTKMQPTNSGL